VQQGDLLGLGGHVARDDGRRADGREELVPIGGGAVAHVAVVRHRRRGVLPVRAPLDPLHCAGNLGDFVRAEPARLHRRRAAAGDPLQHGVLAEAVGHAGRFGGAELGLVHGDLLLADELALEKVEVHTLLGGDVVCLAQTLGGGGKTPIGSNGAVGATHILVLLQYLNVVHAALQLL
jgi:hypothetical protein